MIGRGRSGLATVLAAGALALTACATGSGSGPTTSPTGDSTPSLQTSPLSPAPTPPTSPTATTSPHSPKTPTPATIATIAPTATRRPAPSGGGTTAPADYCTASQLRMRILPGGAEPNYEIAAVTFTNTSSSSCSLSGYPAVQLRRGGRTLATASPDSSSPVQVVRLGPGVQAQAQIRDKITCQAPLSDSIHAVGPAPLTSLAIDSSTSYVQMRGCTVTVDPIALSS
ncbi:MAG: DUF4232 domain-containing protein [Jatrophihabitantaceae bacterium]